MPPNNVILGVLSKQFFFQHSLTRAAKAHPVLLKRNKRILDGMNYEFLFYEDKMVISATSNNLNAEETRLYNEIKYATIIDDLVFLYVTKTQAYIMKNDPNMERIIEFLKSKNINFTKIK